MNIFLDDTELIEIRPVDETEDKGIVITPNKNPVGEVIERQEISDLRKEITAMDSIEMTARKSAEINGVGKSNAALYAKGEGLEGDSRVRVLALRNNIQDVAIAKLMDTLNLLDPNLVEKERDKVAIMTGLSQVIEKLSPAKDSTDKPTVHLHLYSPTQKVEKDYDVIDA
jgi:hypothetical protein